MAQSNNGKVSVSTGADFSHAYFFRGIVQERSGIVAQPYMDMTFSLFEGTEGLNSVAFTIGQWNSLHTGPTGNDGPAIGCALRRHGALHERREAPAHVGGDEPRW